MRLAPLNDHQAEALRYIVAYLRSESRAPTIWEISKVLGMPAYYSVKRLEAKGYISRQSNQPRSIVVLRDPENPTVCPACERPFESVT